MEPISMPTGFFDSFEKSEINYAEKNTNISVENSTSKRKALEFESQLTEKSQPLKKFLTKGVEKALEKDFSLIEIDKMLLEINNSLIEIEEKYPDLEIIDKTFQIITEKCGINANDKNSADILIKQKILHKEIQELNELNIKKSNFIQQSEVKCKEENRKLYDAMTELEKIEKEIQNAKNYDLNGKKFIIEYKNIFNKFGMDVENSQNLFEVKSSTSKMIFEALGTQKYRIKSNSSNMIYKDSQTVYSQELSYIFHRLLITSHKDS